MGCDFSCWQDLSAVDHAFLCGKGRVKGEGGELERAWAA